MSFDWGGNSRRVSLDYALDNEGYLQRECPHSQCLSRFKVLFDHWKKVVAEGAAHCPLCRHQAPWDHWETLSQVAHHDKLIAQGIEQQIDDYISDFVDEINGMSTPGSMFSMSASYEPSPQSFVLPPAASEVMTHRSTCEECGCKYSSTGAAFFCPACGHNSAVSTFDGAIQTIRNTMGNLDALEAMVVELQNKDAARDFARETIERSMERVVSSFQPFAAALFDKVPGRSGFRPSKNAFQNLMESDDLWKRAIGVGYSDLLTPDEFKELFRLVQQRHLLSHRQGIVDQEYLNKTNDTTYKVNQKVLVQRDSVLRLADLVTKLASELKSRT